MDKLQLKHHLSSEDFEVKQAIEACTITPSEFDHELHLRLAYIYLCNHKPEGVYQKMRYSIQAFLKHYGIDASKYHETLTRAWMMAVRYFMVTSEKMKSSREFIAQNEKLLNTDIMLTHYSKSMLFSEEARTDFIKPDLDPIPRYSN